MDGIVERTARLLQARFGEIAVRLARSFDVFPRERGHSKSDLLIWSPEAEYRPATSLPTYLGVRK